MQRVSGMTDDELSALMEQVRSGHASVEQALAALRALTQPGSPLAELDYATVDLQRRDRCGFPEVVYSEGKTAEWLEGVVRQLAAAGQDCLATRLDAVQAEHMARCFPSAHQDRLARTFWLPHGPPDPRQGRVTVVTETRGSWFSKCSLISGANLRRRRWE